MSWTPQEIVYIETSVYLKWGDELPGAATPRRRGSRWTPRRRDAARCLASSRLRRFWELPAFAQVRIQQTENKNIVGEAKGSGDLAAFQALQAPKSMKTGRNEASQFQAGIFRILGVSSSEKQENRKIFGKTKGSGDLPHLRRFKLRKAGKREETKLPQFQAGIFRILGVSSSEKQENGKKRSFSISGGDLPHFRRFKLRKAGKQEDLGENEGFRRSSASKAFQDPKSRKTGRRRSFAISGGDLPHFRPLSGPEKQGKQEDLRENEGFRRSSASKAFQAPKSRKTGRNEASQFQAGIFRILGVSSSEKQENRKILGKTKGSGDLPASKAFQAPKSRKTGRNEASQFQAGIFRILGVSGPEKQENRKIFGKTKGSGDLPHLRRFKLRKAGKREETKLLNFRRGSSAF